MEHIKENEINKDKPLYTSENIINVYDYKKMAKYFPKRFYGLFVKTGIFIDLILSAIIAILSKNFWVTLVFFIIYLVFEMTYSKIKLESKLEKFFNHQVKKGLIKIKSTTEFYENYFIRKYEAASITIKYEDITKCVESDVNFYLEENQEKPIYIIQKYRCDEALVDFIRNKFKNIENHLGEITDAKDIKDDKHYKSKRNLMWILFVLTIVSLFGAMCTLTIVINMIDTTIVTFFKRIWVFWLWLPIPALSIILGSKYKDEGLKCTKNIVAGWIIGAVLLFSGALCLLPVPSVEEYNNIDAYIDVAGVELVDEKVHKMEIVDKIVNFHRVKYTLVEFKYDEKEMAELINNIKNNDNWILSTEIDSHVKKMFPKSFKTGKDVYFSIYNDVLDEYNTIPQKSGKYEVYAMQCDKSTGHLKIQKYTYSVK